MAGVVGAAFIRLVRALVSGRICARDSGRHRRLHCVRWNREFADPNGSMVRGRFLGPGRFHDADDDDHRERVRPRHRAAGLCRDPANGIDSQNRQERGGFRRIVFDAHFAGVMEF